MNLNVKIDNDTLIKVYILCVAIVLSGVLINQLK